MTESKQRLHLLLGCLGLTALVLLWSGWMPKDRFTWFLEVLPVMIGMLLLYATRTSFSLTPLLYGLLTVHAMVLMVGGHYTYADVPLGTWMQQAFGFARNHYDRIGHFTQGFVPAILFREIVLRRSPLRPGAWTFVIVCSFCLSFSALYELFEWRVASRTGEAASAFLGTQGDEWDTQWDMCLALVGSITAQSLLGRAHDRQLSRMGAA